MHTQKTHKHIHAASSTFPLTVFLLRTTITQRAHVRLFSMSSSLLPTLPPFPLGRGRAGGGRSFVSPFTISAASYAYLSVGSSPF